MFRWCSYCQNLIGETEPLDDYRISHGICVKCSKDPEADSSESKLLRARLIFEMLEEAGRGGSLDACKQVIDEALDFGLKPSDIAVGILHPILYQIGEMWERGEITVANEHRFTVFALGLIDQLQFPEPPGQRPLILLANHPKSGHEIGLRILQLLSWERGIPCQRLPVGTPAETILDAAGECESILFGLSVGLVEHIPAALELARTIADRLPDDCTLVLGGQAFRRSGHDGISDGMTVLKTIDEFTARLDSINNEHFRTRTL